MEHCLHIIFSFVNKKHEKELFEAKLLGKREFLSKLQASHAAYKIILKFRLTKCDENPTGDQMILYGNDIVDDLRTLPEFDWEFIIEFAKIKEMLEEDEIVEHMIAYKNTILYYWSDDEKRAKCLAGWEVAMSHYHTNLSASDIGQSG